MPSLIDTADIIQSRNPEPRSMITYLHTIYKVLIADKAEKDKAVNKGEDVAGGEKSGH